VGARRDCACRYVIKLSISITMHEAEDIQAHIGRRSMAIGLHISFGEEQLHLTICNEGSPSIYQSGEPYSRQLTVGPFAEILNIVVVDAVGNRNNVIIAPPAESHHDSKASDAELAKASGPAVEDTPTPILVVEKTGTEPRHGDGFGSHATIAQKDAHDMRAADADPDPTIIPPDTDATDETADTAAEVADSAASIDREPSPLPLSDEEAGRTGERRLSVTPIGEVADTASEVADSAAFIDRDTFDKEVCN